ncbi:MAG: AarF/ABC1/UbiB kinase family protein [Sandaracinaceae bacterium]|nr:AarF/ABC1/UbiB kinase family protein [Sandaracinaceae bacterium]
MADDKERLPGRLARTLKVGLLGSRVGSSYLGGKLADVFRGEGDRERARVERHVDNAKRIAHTMTQLRGPLMKIGQLMSTHAEALPDEMVKLLAPLQTSAPPMRYETIRAVLEGDLGAPPEALFADFEREAVAAASLGQVHRARLADGTRVAVKVQYPGAVASVEGDLSNIHLATKMVKGLLSDLLGQSRFDVTPFAEELAEHLMQETDYCREAYNAKLLYALLEDDPELLVPRVHDSHSGLRVITYDWIEGEPLDWALEHPDRTIRERVVLQLQRAFWLQFFGGGLLHADPHPGNFKVLSDGRLGILDYGCVKIFEEPFLRAFGRMMHAEMEGDEEALRDVFVELGLMEDRDSDVELEDMEKVAAYFSAGVREDVEFDFSTFDYPAAGRELVMHFLTRRRPPPARRDFLFLSRVVLGYYEYFARAKVKMNFHRYVRPYFEHGFTGRRIEIPPWGE